MPVVFLSIGSNLHPVKNIQLAVRELRRNFGEIQLSSVYRSKPYGFSGDDFLNLVAGVETDLKPEQIVALIEQIHTTAGRRRGGSRFASRELDIDLLLYGDLVSEDLRPRIPRRDVLAYSFVLAPLVEIAPDVRHPVTGKSLRQHWDEFDQDSHPLTVELGVLS